MTRRRCSFCRAQKLTPDEVDNGWCMFIKPHSTRLDRKRDKVSVIAFEACANCASRFYADELWKGKRARRVEI